jgi:hypothetical protein
LKRKEQFGMSPPCEKHLLGTCQGSLPPDLSEFTQLVKICPQITSFVLLPLKLFDSNFPHLWNPSIIKRRIWKLTSWYIIGLQ